MSQENNRIEGEDATQPLKKYVRPTLQKFGRVRELTTSSSNRQHRENNSGQGHRNRI